MISFIKWCLKWEFQTPSHLIKTEMWYRSIPFLLIYWSRPCLNPLLSSKNYTWLKNTSLFCPTVSRGEIKFYNICTRWRPETKGLEWPFWDEIIFSNWKSVFKVSLFFNLFLSLLLLLLLLLLLMFAAQARVLLIWQVLPVSPSHFRVMNTSLLLQQKRQKVFSLSLANLSSLACYFWVSPAYLANIRIGWNV